MKTFSIPILFFFLLSSFLFCSCADQHFIKDQELKKSMKEKLLDKQNKINNPLLFAPLNSIKKSKEKEALEYLYAFMPIGDVSDYDYSLYSDAVKYSLLAREEMPWGKNIPEDIFLHFVLPVRVNNETLDTSRQIFYNELKDRVKNLSMYNAVLEVNHWCHEKAIYTPSDARTSAALATVKTAYGRCGEESTFTTAALRAIGIPARQVYTPRWAHTDDNHAWVEAWVDGKWYYLGACEPEPKLNVAWFSSTAKRGMLMHSRVFGPYSGQEDVIDQNLYQTEINVTSNYADTDTVKIIVKDQNGKNIENALVEFKIYNYAEFYSAMKKKTNSQGEAFGIFGKGDILVWISKNNIFSFQKVSVGKDKNPIIITLKDQSKNQDIIFEEIDIIPPPETSVDVKITKEEWMANNARIAHEDSIRTAYISTFPNENQIEGFIKQHPQFIPYTKKIQTFIIASRGNWDQIFTYLQSIPTDRLAQGITLLELISEKDLRDTPAKVLLDHLLHVELSDDPIYLEYVMNPRITIELLTPWRSFFKNHLDNNKYHNNPQNIIDFVKTIHIADTYNPQKLAIQPIGVFKLMMADKDSRNNFFVAICRTFDIPARLEPVNGKLQYYNKETHQWMDVNFEETVNKQVSQGWLKLNYRPQKHVDDPKFDSHFSIAKIVNGRIETLTFRNKEGYESTNSWKSSFIKPAPLDEGDYMITSGVRMASGKVLSRVSFFTIHAGKTTTADLVLRQDNTDIQVIGNMDAEAKFTQVNSSNEISILQSSGRGYFIIGLMISNNEPCNHAIRDIAKYKDEFEKWGRRILLLYPEQDQFEKYEAQRFPALPSNIEYGIDKTANDNNTILNMIKTAMKITGKEEYPVFIIADTFGRIIYFSAGYNIGTGEQLLKILSSI